MFLLDVVEMSPGEELFLGISQNPEKLLPILAIAAIVIIALVIIKK